MPKVKKQSKPKYGADTITIVKSRVVGIEQQNVEIGNKIKNVFYLQSQVYPETGRLCIMWGYTSFGIGDLSECKGRILDEGTFLIWSFMVLERVNK